MYLKQNLILYIFNFYNQLNIFKLQFFFQQNLKFKNEIFVLLFSGRKIFKMDRSLNEDRKKV